MRFRRLLPFIAVVQAILFFGHFILYATWSYSPAGVNYGSPWLAAVMAVLSVTFVSASLAAWRSHNVVVRVLYRIAAVWLGWVSFLVAAAAAAWIVCGVAKLGGWALDFHRTVEWLFGAAVAAGIFGLFNAQVTRITHATVKLANLPENWRGRKAALVSDLHLGHVRNRNFLRRIVAKILREQPDAVFIAGDLFDGTAIDAHRATEPLAKLTAPHGVYFVAGNHEQFGDDRKFLDAISTAGVRVLHSEKVEADGLQIIGVPWNQATQDGHLAAALRGARVDRERASILLTHAPDWPHVAEAHGVSLQLSGHTHLGQFIPWSWLARRVYRQFTYGLSRIGNMQVFTSSGAGTWGPPLRLGSNPEIVMLEFE